MEKIYITASECLTAFKAIGLNVTKGAFSKQKEKGIYKIYHKENSKRDLFIFDEVLSSYLGSTIPKDHIEDKLRAEIKKNHEIHKMINEQWTIIESYENLTFEMFDINRLYDPEKNKTKEEHIKDFKLDLYAVNETRLNNRDLAGALCEDLEKVYKDFKGSTLNYYILKSFADWMSLSTPKDWADSCGVDLIAAKEKEEV